MLPPASQVKTALFCAKPCAVIPGLAPQALCLRLLRRLKAYSLCKPTLGFDRDAVLTDKPAIFVSNLAVDDHQIDA